MQLRISNELGEQDYFHGNTLSLTDIAVVSALGYVGLRYADNFNVKEPDLRACIRLTPAGPIATRSLNSSASQAGVGTKPCLTNIFIQRGALRATISAS